MSSVNKKIDSAFLFRVWETLPDALTVFCLCGAVLYGFVQVLALPVKLVTVFFAALLGAAFLCLPKKALFVVPAFLLGLVGSILLRGVVHHALPDEIGWISDFFLWLSLGMPESTFCENGSLFLVLSVLSVLLSQIIYIPIRRFCSLIALIVVSAGLVVYLAILPCETILFPLLLCVSALILTLPRTFLKLQKVDEGEISRASVQRMAIPVALIVALFVLAVAPKSDGQWKSKKLSLWAEDIADQFQFLNGNLSGHVTFDLSEYGYMPNGDSLGGDAVPADIPAFSVTGGTKNDLYRGRIYSTYTGKNWIDTQNYGSFRFDSLLSRRQRNTAFDLRQPVNTGDAKHFYHVVTQTVHYKLRYETRGERMIFAHGNTREVVCGNDDIIEPRFDLQGELFAPTSIPISDTVTVSATTFTYNGERFDLLFEALEREIRKGSDPNYQAVCDTYLQLPDTLSPSVYELTREIAGEESDPFKQMMLLKNWLYDNCIYTLSPGDPPEDEDFVTHFLEERQGYCTYYASALTVMARILGLPSRYVTGFAVRPMPNSTKVFQADGQTAHAWCETYFEGIGWLTFDALQPIIEQMNEQNEEEIIPMTLPEPEHEWQREEIAPKEEIMEEEEPDLLLLTLIGLPVALLFLALLVFGLYRAILNTMVRRYRLSRLLRRCPDPTARMKALYADTLRQLALLDMVSAPRETLRVFTSRIDRILSLPAQEFAPIGRSMERVLYALSVPTEEDLLTLHAFHSELEKKLMGDLGKREYIRRRIFRREKKEE